MDNGLLTGGIFLDLSKAFDLIDHTILKKKLSAVGLSNNALDWFDNYLDGRSQSVCVNGSTSEVLSLRSGVPQGSVLGPLLFIIFINDLPSCITKSKIVLYADDTALFFAHKDTKTIESVLQQELNAVADWLHQNNLVINCSKTNIVLFGTSQRLAKAHKPSINLGDSTLAYKDPIKYLGLVMDSKMT